MWSVKLNETAGSQEAVGKERLTKAEALKAGCKWRALLSISGGPAEEEENEEEDVEENKNGGVRGEKGRIEKENWAENQATL